MPALPLTAAALAAALALLASSAPPPAGDAPTKDPAPPKESGKAKGKGKPAAKSESDYYAKLSAFLSPIRALVLVTALLVAAGGILGGVNAMYAAFASRVREAGTLQALGFSRLAVAASLVLESTVACVAGSLIACLVGIAALDGLSIRFTMGSFGVVVDSHAVLAGMLTGLGLGLLGALPAIARCLTLSIPTALRS